MSFNFNQKIDRPFLSSMYEDDYQYIEEIFNTTRQQLGGDIQKVEEAFGQADQEALRKAVHKIKPAFGFVGLLETEAVCQKFEDNCISVSSASDLKPQYENLLAIIKESQKILEEEYMRLREHNN